MNFFFPQTIHFPDTKFNKNIYLSQYLHYRTLIVDNLIESGDIMTHIWKKGITYFLPKTFNPKNVLLLGLAGGSNAHLINHYYPEAKITAIEIDPLMVEIGRKYFDLQKVKNLRIVIDDAYDYVIKMKKSDQYDLVLVDCFAGQSIPKKLEKINFIKQLKNHSRFVLINRLWWAKEKSITINFFRSLAPHFFFVKVHTATNVLISLV